MMGEEIPMRLAIAAAVAIAAVGFVGQAVAQDIDLMEYADADKDGKVTLAEFTSFSEQGWGFISQGADKVKVADIDPMFKGSFTGVVADASGMADKAAFMAAVPGRFKAADKNGDGTLSKEELTASLAPPAA
jgi:hypothetical protein